MKKNRMGIEVYRNYVLILQIGIHMLTPVIVCVALGVFLDSKFHGYFTLIFMILGILAGGRNAYMLAKRGNVTSEREKQSKEEQELVDDALRKWNTGTNGQDKKDGR